MILINLLPHREAARKRRRDRFYFALGGAALLGGAIAMGAYAGYQFQVLNQQARNTVLQTEIGRLDRDIRQISALQAEIDTLRARQQAVEDLQEDRNSAVHLLNELARQVPDGVFLTSLKQENQSIVLRGMAQSNERVSEFLRNLAHRSVWLVQPELMEITTGSVSLNPFEQRRVAHFMVRAGLTRPTKVKKAVASP